MAPITRAELERDSEKCRECGRRYALVWLAPDDLWNQYADGPGGTACPDCFSVWALNRGLLIRFEAVIAIDVDARLEELGAA